MPFCSPRAPTWGTTQREKSHVTRYCSSLTHSSKPWSSCSLFVRSSPNTRLRVDGILHRRAKTLRQKAELRMAGAAVLLCVTGVVLETLATDSESSKKLLVGCANAKEVVALLTRAGALHSRILEVNGIDAKVDNTTILLDSDTAPSHLALSVSAEPDILTNVFSQGAVVALIVKNASPAKGQWRFKEPVVVDGRGLEPSLLPDIPQTIEYALCCAQKASRQCLEQERGPALRFAVELPSGRFRENTAGGIGMVRNHRVWMAQSSILARKYAEMFRGVRIRLVLGAPPELEQKLVWLDQQLLPDVVRDEHWHTSASDYDVLIISSVSGSQKSDVERVVGATHQNVCVVLFNCFLDLPLQDHFGSFPYAYCFRFYENVGATSKETPDEDAWNTFVEVSPFELEYVRTVHSRNSWWPSRASLEREFVDAGLRRFSRGTGYFTRPEGYRSAGFWPFMSPAMPFCWPVTEKEIHLLRRSRKRSLLGFEF
ncbi:hypothetical protein FVE85_5272 [Porphyridium purpureum]|uniref:Uncharacterized protein n=1 Tax=Porphyridium purpureum TaxID=35688 RepID=A0A5J4Z513_PORPP|nr:hypothetical protein FVE85_5272 [Porphyridium purpureum]|eukprot:POR2351..scf295_1